jgi:hypothetical protein
VPEQLALDELAAQGGRIDCHEAAASPALEVKRVRNELLTRTTRPSHEHRKVEARHAAGSTRELPHGGSVSDQAVERALFRDGSAELALHPEHVGTKPNASAWSEPRPLHANVTDPTPRTNAEGLQDDLPVDELNVAVTSIDPRVVNPPIDARPGPSDRKGAAR